eukprot:TRINITY_DN67327_c3_g1_i22.p1 TRINITY_DN67327_c3_g1~~TRINITY_DN67327_c3_g1_i22.p1  ORF type:complete len:378 (-),score=26.86 TRINITY_DN67327_c3_g1_i22:1221-2354(-)
MLLEALFRHITMPVTGVHHHNPVARCLAIAHALQWALVATIISGSAICSDACVIPWNEDESYFRIMPLGDSITQGGLAKSAYRHSLFTVLRNNNYMCRFVGTRNKSTQGQDTVQTHFDVWHEGWSGRRTKYFVKYGVVEKAMQLCYPDIVLVHLGTNDLLATEPHSMTVKHLIWLLKILNKVHPAVTVLLSTVIPMKGAEKRIKALNKQLTGTVEKYAPTFNKTFTCANATADCLASVRRAQRLKFNRTVLLVDIGKGLNLKSDFLKDGIHPNDEGHDKIAHNWYKYLTTYILPAPTPNQTVPQPHTSQQTDQPDLPLGNNTANEEVGRTDTNVTKAAENVPGTVWIDNNWPLLQMPVFAALVAVAVKGLLMLRRWR